MINEKELIDKIHLQKYLFLIDAFLQKKIEASVFEKLFIIIRREDEYWKSNSFSEQISKILDSIFLDIDEYNPEEFYDPNNEFNINEFELRVRLKNKVVELAAWSASA